MSCLIFSSTTSAQQRYQSRSVNTPADQFLARANQPVINVDFIVAHTINTVFHAIREGRELGDSAILQSDGNAGSVVIEAGTNVGDLIIINDNEGDNIVVNK